MSDSLVAYSVKTSWHKIAVPATVIIMYIQKPCSIRVDKPQVRRTVPTALVAILKNLFMLFP